MDSGPIWSLILQLILILINAFFAMSEIALLSLNENKLRKQEEEGDAKAGRLLKIIQQPEGFLSTIQIGITLAGFLGSAFAADNFASGLADWLRNSCGITAVPLNVLNTLSVIVITLILSYFTLVFGELVPKRIAMKRTEQVAKAVSGVVSGVAKITKPVVWLLSASTNAVLRLFGIDPNDEAEEVTEEEIRMLVDIGGEKGTIQANEKEMIENIFEFDNMTAEDTMIHRTDVVAVSIDNTQEEVFKIVDESGLSRLPVYDDNLDDVQGILFTRDFLINMHIDQPKTLQELLRPAYFVPESVKTDVLFREMQTNNVHMAIVVDEYGGTSGIVTMEDLLEEIVGNIYDEFDPAEEQDVIQISDDTWRVAGGVDLETMDKVIGIEVPDDVEYDTLGGLVFSQFSSIPKDGSQPELEVYNLKIQVEEIIDRRVEWALVTKLEEEKEEDGEEAAKDKGRNGKEKDKEQQE